jgi:hypothetical protein
MAQERDIKYINREFSDFRSQLIEFAKNYFPDSYNDFSPTSPGMMFIEMAAYVGDILSFYQDTQLQETFLQHAQNPSNLYSLAYMMGYRPRVTSIAEVELEVSQRVAAAGVNYLPNYDQAIRVAENGTITSTVGDNAQFITTNVVDFKFSSSYDPTDIRVFSLDNNNPAEYLLTKKVKAYSGEIKTTTETYTTAERFATIEIEDTDIIGILDITDSDGNKWYEVPFLGQDTIFDLETNTSSDNATVPNRLLLKKVPKRFVSRFTSKGVLQIQFGSGVIGQEDNTFLPNPTTIDSGYNSAESIGKLDYSFDPSNVLFTRTYGLAPSNTTLTIRYLTGGGVGANVPSNTITTIGTVTTTATDSTYLSTLTFNNPKPAAGGRDGDTVEELRQNSLKSFAEQKRAVTLQDYNIRALGLPAQYGSIAKVYVTQDNTSNVDISMLSKNPLALSLYVLAYDADGKITTATETLKQNLKTYLSEYMMITDALDIKDAFVVNIGVKFQIVTLPDYPARDVLLQCNTKVQEFFNIRNWNINQPINLANLYTELDKIKGVQTVKNIEIVNKNGGNYSVNGYDVNGATRDNVVYPSFDPCIFEVKFPNIDIEGRVTTL